MVTRAAEEKVPGRDISRATGVAEATIRSTYQELRPHAAKLAPDWFADRDVNTKLPAS